MGKKEFENFLQEVRPLAADLLLREFEKFHAILWEENQKINLVSRKTLPQEYWTNHFLDSILPIKYFDLNNARILDFGTGGGLPGIPLAILLPASQIYLLDSKQKKIGAIRSIIKKLDVKNCFTIVSRIEEVDRSLDGSFDFIVCRSVKIIPEFVPSLFRLLKPNGKILLYKSKILDDTEQFENKKIIDMSHVKIGERKLVVIWQK